MNASTMHDRDENVRLYILLKWKLHFVGSNNMYFDRCVRCFGSKRYFHL